jgi:hypothetical protein
VGLHSTPADLIIDFILQHGTAHSAATQFGDESYY